MIALLSQDGLSTMRDTGFTCPGVRDSLLLTSNFLLSKKKKKRKWW